MRAVIDARPALDPRRTGVGLYTQQIIRHLPHADPDNEYVAWYLHAKGLFRPRRFFEGVNATNLTEKASRFPARVFGPMSTRLGVPRIEWSGAFDVLLATNFLPPATHSPGVVMVVHDLAHEHLPETAPHMDPRWRRRFDRWLQRAAGVIVPSASTKPTCSPHTTSMPIASTSRRSGSTSRPSRRRHPMRSRRCGASTASMAPTPCSSEGSSLARTSICWSRRSRRWSPARAW